LFVARTQEGMVLEKMHGLRRSYFEMGVFWTTLVIKQHVSAGKCPGSIAVVPMMSGRFSSF
jgi:hypothetical protein